MEWSEEKERVYPLELEFVPYRCDFGQLRSFLIFFRKIAARKMRVLRVPMDEKL